MKYILNFIIVIWVIIASCLSYKIIDEINDDTTHFKLCLSHDLEYINGFQSQHNQLPTEKEFYDWRDISIDNREFKENSKDPRYVGSIYYIRNSNRINDELLTNVNWNENFVLSIFNNLESHYYLSWTNEYYMENDNFLYKFGLVIVLFIPAILLQIMKFAWYKFGSEKISFNSF